MARAILGGVVVAESDDVVVVERNVYFPRAAVRDQHVRPSRRRTWCPWKGRARYFDVVAGDAVVRAGAWYYPETTRWAAHLRGRVAFRRGVEVER
jgi:uncharacterized protein (DUF427 family)